MKSYPFADRAAEDERLIAQGRLFDPGTRRLLRAAGLAPGMRVLDLGSGAGNVARLAAELVGPEGAVVGIDADPAAVERARQHTDAANVQFQVADVQTLDGVAGGFDMVLGRLVLMYLPDPADALRQAVSRLRPGGLVCMHEADLTYLWASPETPLWAQARAWFMAAMDQAGIETRMGLKLYSTFAAAGMPQPRLLMDTYAEGGPNAPTWGWANLMSAAVPLMEQLGVASRAEVDPDTLASRLLSQTLAAGGYVITPPMTGAWAVRPADS
jgi:ubiquinone/menaquinone biosynthesis C-methylase UbiE